MVYTSNVTDSSFGDGTLGALQQTYYEKRAQDRLLSNLVFYNACEKKRLPKNSGQIMQFYRYVQISGTGSLTTALAEDAISTNSASLSATTATVTVAPYGAHVVLSKLAIDSTRSGQLIEDAVDVLTDTASEIVDTLVRTSLQSNASALYGTDGGDTSATITTSDTLSEVTCRAAVKHLRTMKVRPFNEGQMFLGIISPKQAYDLQSTTAAGSWAAAASYSDPQKIWTGQIASMHGVRLLMSQNLNTSFASTLLTSSVTANACDSFFIGAGAVAAVSLEDNPIQVIRKTGDSNSTYDAYNNRASVAVKLPGFGVCWIGTDSATQKRALRIVTATSA